jgi:hypothetical protein
VSTLYFFHNGSAKKPGFSSDTGRYEVGTLSARPDDE